MSALNPFQRGPTNEAGWFATFALNLGPNCVIGAVGVCLKCSNLKFDGGTFSIFKKFIIFGIFVCGLFWPPVGLYLAGDVAIFTSGSEASEIHVTMVQRKKNTDGGYHYKPHFMASDKGGVSIRYFGNSWVSPKPHSAGDIVGGRVNWASVEIRSSDMMRSQFFMGVFFILAGFLMLWIRYFLLQRHRASTSNA